MKNINIIIINTDMSTTIINKKINSIINTAGMSEA